MNKISFINSPTQWYPEDGRDEVYSTMPPYGLGYVATAAQEIVGRSNVALIDGENLGTSPRKTVELALENHPDYVGINVASPTYEISKDIIKRVGNNLGYKRIIVGGPHAILYPQQLLNDDEISKYIRFVSTGDGEGPIQQLLSGKSDESIDGIAYRTSDGLIVKEPYRCPQDLLDNLFVDRRFFRNDPGQFDKRVESYVLSSRGCAFGCGFCAAKSMNDRKVRFRSTESIQYELQTLLNNGVNYIRFVDDLLLISEKRTREIAEVFNKLGIGKHNFGFEANARANILARFDDSVWNLLHEMGMKEIELGIESGSPKILKDMRKGILPEQVVAVVRRALDYKMCIKGFLMVGYPNETVEDLELTLELAKSLKNIGGENVRFSPVPVKAYPGTEIYTQTRQLLDNRGLTLGADVIVDFNKDTNIHLSTRELDIVSQRGRYNAMHTLEGNPIALSDLSGGASTSDVLWYLSQLILTSSEGKVNQPENELFLHRKEY